MFTPAVTPPPVIVEVRVVAGVEGFERSHDPTQLGVHVPAADGRVVGDFRNDVGVQVGGGGLIASHVKLAVEARIGKHYARAQVLVRILNRKGHGPLFAGMIDHAQLALASPGNAQLVIRILHLGDEEVSGHRGNARAARSHQGPSLTAQQLKLAPHQLRPIMTQAEGAGVAGDEEAAGVVAGKVSLDVAGDVALANLGSYFHAYSRVLSQGPNLRHAPRGVWHSPDYAIGYGAEGSGHAAAKVRGPEDRGEVHETSRRKLRIADLEREGRGLGFARLSLRTNRRGRD